MKNKGISFFEQNVEKFVLAGAGVVFVSVLAWQLFPNSVKLDGQDVAFSEIDGRIQEKAQLLDAKLKQPVEPLRKQLEGRLADAAPSFAERLGKGVAPGSSLPSIQPRLASALQSDGVAAGVAYHVPRFPSVEMRSTVQVDDTLDPSVLVQHESLKDRFAPGAPLDISWTVPSAVLDLKRMRAELESDRDGAAIPRLWYRDALFLVDVEFERERQQADGSWGDRQIVYILPGGSTFRDRYQSSPDAALRDVVWTTLDDQSSQRAVIQPDFLATKRGNFSPGLLLAASEEGDAGEDPAIRRLRKEVAKREIEFQRVSDDLKEIGGPLEEQSREERKREEDRKKREEERNRGGSGGGGSGGASRPGGGLGGGGLGGGMSGRRNESSASNDEATKERRIRMTKRLAELERTLKNRQDELSKLLEAQGLAAAAATAATASSNMLAADEIVVWGHDIGVKPGNRYRYRAVVHAYNPFFTNAGVLVEDQKGLGSGFTLATAASDWSSPFEVTPPIAFFVVDAVPGEGRLGVGQATVEIYRYFDGERRRERVTLQPGDAIAAEGRDGVGYGTGYFMVDVIPDPIRDRGGNDRRPTALVVVQSANGDTYQVRVPESELRSPMRQEFDDQIELAKTELERGGSSAPASGAGNGGGNAGGKREDGYTPRG